MDPARAIKVSRINWITQPVAIYALATGKISVAFLIIRIMGKSKWRKAFLMYGALMGSFVICTISVILTFAQCQPVTALWDTKLLLTGEASCWPPRRQSDFSLFTGSMFGLSGITVLLWSMLTENVDRTIRLAGVHRPCTRASTGKYHLESTDESPEKGWDQCRHGPGCVVSPLHKQMLTEQLVRSNAVHPVLAYVLVSKLPNYQS